MKKLITLMLLAFVGGVGAVSAEDLLLHNYNNSWGSYPAFSNDGVNDKGETVWTYVLNSSTGLNSDDFYFRLKFSDYNDDFRPYYNSSSNNNDYVLLANSSLISDGLYETYKLKHSDGDIWTNPTTGSGAFCIPNSTIKASEYKISVYAKKGDVYYVKAEIVSDVSVEVSSDGFATFSSECALDFTGTGITAYIAESTENGNVTMTPVTKVPANTGLFLVGTTDDIPVIAPASAEAVVTNYLHPTDGTTDIYNTTNPCYVLANQGGVGFFKVTSSCTPAKGKAYLQLESPVTSSRLNILFDEATGIKNIAARQTSGEAYNLHGQRIAQPAKGLYIVNGKKVIKK